MLEERARTRRHRENGAGRESGRLDGNPQPQVVIATPLGVGAHEYGNMGDVAMLQVAVTRLRKLWPHAILHVLTHSAASLAIYCPGATPLPKAGLRIWMSDGVGLGRFSQEVPSWVVRLLVAAKRDVRVRWPGLQQLLLRLKPGSRHDPADLLAMARFNEAMRTARLVVVCGSGGFYDGSPEWNFEILNLVEYAIRRRVPVAMLGQGFGPLKDAAVLSMAQRLLPSVDLITLRGSPGADELLAGLGVPPSRVRTTGDEAIEMAFDARPLTLGKALGVNLRLGGSAQTDATDLARVRAALEGLAARHAVEIIPVPIALDSYHADHWSISALLAGLDPHSDGGASLDSPMKVIRQAGRCRVVVTGAYHAAVFALSQGIPVVGLARSAYFIDKIQGLANQFGLGCETVILDRPDAGRTLVEAIERAWRSADDVHGPLLEAARRQITAGHGAYDRVKDLVTEGRR
jgi:polysaccharide pyruvyl transferase WcaK-like protein